MKPTSPEEKELEEMGADVSRQYRAGAQDEPPPQLDAKILEAARNELKPAQRKRDWQVPASIAAVLVVAVSLGVAVRDREPPFPTLDGAAAPSAAGEARLAKPASPQLALKEQPKQKTESVREARPSRDRVERPDRELLAARDQAARSEAAVAAPPTAADAMAPAPAVSAPSQATPPAPAIDRQPAEAKLSPPSSDVQIGARGTEVESANDRAPVAKLAPPKVVQSTGVRGISEESMKERDYVARAAAEAEAPQKAGNASTLAKRSAAAGALRKQDDAPPPSPQEWIRRIEGLLKDGKQADARDQLLAMRRHYPTYPLTEPLQALLGGAR